MPLTPEEIKNRFGYLHPKLRHEFISFASGLNEVLPDGQAKSVAMTELENASMWANKAVAEQTPVVDE